MKVATMRFLDRWLGVPLCFLFTLFARLSGGKHTGKHKGCKRILFIKLAEQGATVLACPAIGRAVEMVGRRNVFFLVFEENSAIFEPLDIIPLDNIITIPTRGFGSFLWGTVSSLIKILLLKPDITIEMEFFSRFSAILAFLSGAGLRVGFHSFAGGGPYRGDLMTHRLNYNPHLHISRMYLAMVEAARTPPGDLPALEVALQVDEGTIPKFTPDSLTVKEVRTMLATSSNWEDGSRLILLNANCSDLLPLRRWPSHHYVELAQRLIERYPNILIGFTGQQKERAEIDRLVTGIDSDRCFSLAGRTTFRQLLGVYTLAEVLVTNDSGPAHFAALTPVEVVTLFGPETPAIFGSLSTRNHIMYAALACSPCVNAYNGRQSPCVNNLCLQALSVDSVFDTVCRILAETVRKQKKD